MSKKILWVVLRYCLFVAILWWFRKNFTEINFQRFWDLTALDIVFLVVVKGCSYFLGSARFVLVAQQLNGKIPYSTAFALNNLGLLTSYLIPSSVLSDVSKIYYLKKYIPSYIKMISAMFIDRLAGLVSMVVLLVATTATLAFFSDVSEQAIYKQTEWLRQAFVIGMMALFIIGMLLWWQKKRWIESYKRKMERLNISQLSLGFFLKIFLMSLLAHGLCVFLIFRMNQLVGQVPLSLLDSGVVFSSSTLGTAVPTTPGSLGVGQAIYKYIIDHLTGTVTDTGILVFTLFQLLDIPFLLIGLLFFIKNISFKKETAR